MKTYENESLLKQFQCIVIQSKNDYQHTSKVLFSFVPNKKFGQLINISPYSLAMMSTVNTEFNLVLFKFGLQIKSVKHLKLKIMLIFYWVSIIKMTYSTEPKLRKYVKGYIFLSLARKFVDKCSKKLMDTATKTGIDAVKTASKRVVQKTAEATGDLIGNKIADKTTSLGK